MAYPRTTASRHSARQCSEHLDGKCRAIQDYLPPPTPLMPRQPPRLCIARAGGTVYNVVANAKPAKASHKSHFIPLTRILGLEHSRCRRRHAQRSLAGLCAQTPHPGHAHPFGFHIPPIFHAAVVRSQDHGSHYRIEVILALVLIIAPERLNRFSRRAYPGINNASVDVAGVNVTASKA